MSQDDGVLSIGDAKFNINDTVNSVVNVMTLGAAGVDKDGKLKAGAQLRALDEGLGEVTGRNAQREALNEQKKQVAEEKQIKNAEIAAEQTQRMRNDFQASNTAASLRATAASKSKNLLGDTSKDFLGL